MVVAEHADGVGAAALAVGHLGDVGLGVAAGGSDFGRVGGAEFAERGAFHRVQRQVVHGVSAQFGGEAGDVGDAVQGDAGDEDGVDLDRDAAGFESGDGRLLAGDDQLPGRAAAQDFAAVAHPPVDLSGNVGVDGVHGDGDVADAQLGDRIQMGWYFQAVAGHTQQQVRVAFFDQRQTGQGLVGVRERVARAGDADHGQVRHLGPHPVDIVGGLFRRQDRGGHPRAGFRHTVELAVAVVALHIARGATGRCTRAVRLRASSSKQGCSEVLSLAGMVEVMGDSVHM